MKLPDETWNEMCYLKLLKPETFQFSTHQRSCLSEYETWSEMCYLKFFKVFNPSQWLLIQNFQMRLKTRDMLFDLECLKLFKHITGVAYSKLSDETWNKMWYLKPLKLQTFSTHHRESCLPWNFQMRLGIRFTIWYFWNLTLFKHIMSWVAYLKLSDETWNEMCYLKHLKP